jgi:hypothetical protein
MVQIEIGVLDAFGRSVALQNQKGRDNARLIELKIKFFLEPLPVVARSD